LTGLLLHGSEKSTPRLYFLARHLLKAFRLWRPSCDCHRCSVVCS
jgi:hypothetical protein